ncbi:rod shape-determining protein MreC [bacterium]|nr:MAG: rod shape-determining protein MreC [bacterium]
MKSFRVLILGIAFVAVVLAIFLSRAALAHFFQNLRVLVFGSADPNFSYESYEDLKMENNVLTQNSLGGKNGEFSFDSGRYRYKTASVFSDYPFNNYASLIVNAGSDDGIKVGMPVLSGEGVLLGKIKEVSRTQSEVATIFDPNWRSAAAFGPNRVKALLIGGPAPYLDLISKEATTTIGDSVFNLAKDFPLNLNLGKILSSESEEEGIWFKAKIEPPVHFEGLAKVLVILDFP